MLFDRERMTPISGPLQSRWVYFVPFLRWRGATAEWIGSWICVKSMVFGTLLIPSYQQPTMQALYPRSRLGFLCPDSFYLALRSLLCNYFATTLSRSVLNHSKQSRCTATIILTVCLKIMNMLLQCVLQKHKFLKQNIRPLSDVLFEKLVFNW